MRANMTKLMHTGHAGNNSPVVNDHLSGQLCIITQDDMIPHNTVVGNMYISHDQVVVTDYSFPFGSSSPVYGHIFTNSVIITNFNGSVFSFELQVLRCATKN